jgi:hypothetical protein
MSAAAWHRQALPSIAMHHQALPCIARHGHAATLWPSSRGLFLRQKGLFLGLKFPRRVSQARR